MAFKCSVCGKEKGIYERFYGSKCQPCYSNYIFKSVVPLTPHQKWEIQKPKPPLEFVKHRSPEGYEWQMKIYKDLFEEWLKNEPNADSLAK